MSRFAHTTRMNLRRFFSFGYTQKCTCITHMILTPQAFDLSAKFPSLYTNMYLVCAEKTLWEVEHSLGEEASTSFMPVLYPSGIGTLVPRIVALIKRLSTLAHRFLSQLNGSNSKPHLLERLYLAWQGRGLPLDKLSLETRRSEICSQYIDDQPRRHNKVWHFRPAHEATVRSLIFVAPS